MIVSLVPGADAPAVLRALAERGLWASRVERDADGAAAHVVLAPHSAACAARDIAAIDGVARVTTAASAHPLVDAQPATVEVAGRLVGPAHPLLVAGPCSIESEAHIRAAAEALAARGVPFLRGGAFKPRTSPYAFQGHGEPALRWMRAAADATGMKCVTEALGEGDVPCVAEHADVIQVGSRNMQNFALLKAVGRAKRPVLLKRGLAATVDEWLGAGEYVLAHGAPCVVFCERGVRGFDEATRNVLDLGAVALLANVLGQPVLVDPSHGAGRRDLVLPLARAAMAAGACGVMVEAHDTPGAALSDGPQAIGFDDVAAIARDLRARGRTTEEAT